MIISRFVQEECLSLFSDFAQHLKVDSTNIKPIIYDELSEFLKERGFIEPASDKESRKLNICRRKSVSRLIDILNDRGARNLILPLPRSQEAANICNIVSAYLDHLVYTKLKQSIEYCRRDEIKLLEVEYYPRDVTQRKNDNKKI
jgi:hypothetical protein